MWANIQRVGVDYLPKRNWEMQTASLVEFLRTGILGPVNFGLTMLEAAALLGPPRGWVTDASDCPVPIYWTYNYLEIEFQQEPPYEINWFQIEHPDALARPRHKLADVLTLSMDRINVSVPPSRMLRHFRGMRNVVVATPKDPDWAVLQICNGGVCLIYGIMDEYLESFVEYGTDSHRWLRDFDRHCFIDSIYSFREPALEHVSPPDKYRNMPAVEYLAIIEGGRP